MLRRGSAQAFDVPAVTATPPVGPGTARGADVPRRRPEEPGLFGVPDRRQVGCVSSIGIRPSRFADARVYAGSKQFELKVCARGRSLLGLGVI